MSGRPTVTFAVIARRRIEPLDRLVSHILQMKDSPVSEIVVAVESDEVTEARESVDENGVRWIDVPARRGLGYNRNRVIDAARGDVLVWTDDDCLPEPGWFESLLGALDDPTIDAAAGNIRIPPAGLLGDAISALGFPAGGSAGYATMFTVYEDGTTDNLPSGNSAIRASVVRQLGGFDESMTIGGEDTEFSYRFRQAGHRIRFCPDAVVTHPARTNVIDFCSWSFRRGRAKRQLAMRVPVGGYVGNRFASFGRILSSNATDSKILLIVPLLSINVALQLLGFVVEAVAPTPRIIGNSRP